MKVLITAASKHGSTEEIAVAIARILEQDGLTVDVRPPDEVGNVASYDAVVIGSAVYMGRWMEPAKAFVARHHHVLSRIPVWLYSTGPLGEPPKPEAEPVDVADMLAATLAKGHRTFPGRLTKHDLGLVERVIATGVHAPEGDFRPWDEIAAWAGEIAGILRADGTLAGSAPTSNR